MFNSPTNEVIENSQCHRQRGRGNHTEYSSAVGRFARTIAQQGFVAQAGNFDHLTPPQAKKSRRGGTPKGIRPRRLTL
jgi:hypothetical protein